MKRDSPGLSRGNVTRVGVGSKTRHEHRNSDKWEQHAIQVETAEEAVAAAVTCLLQYSPRPYKGNQ